MCATLLGNAVTSSRVGASSAQVLLVSTNVLVNWAYKRARQGTRVCALSVIRREGGTLTLGEKRVRACVCVPQAAERALRRLQVERRFPTSNDNLLELRVSFLTRISRSRG